MLELFKKCMQAGVWVGSIALLSAVGFLLLSARFSIPGGYRLYAVLSGSMMPTIPVGSLVITQTPHTEIPKDTIITFEEAGSKRLITHRVIETKPDGLFITKGDANSTADIAPVAYGHIKGVYKTHLPSMGIVVEFIKSPSGLVLFVGVPALILIVQELRNIVNVLVEKKVKRILLLEKQTHKVKVTMVSLMIVLAGLQIVSSRSYALFTAAPVTITHNTLATATVFSTPSPSPTPIVQPCDNEIIINQSNTNTGPGSVNINEVDIENNCQRQTVTTSHNTTTINIQIH